jgi:hypothetical protein
VFSSLAPAANAAVPESSAVARYESLEASLSVWRVCEQDQQYCCRRLGRIVRGEAVSVLDSYSLLTACAKRCSPSSCEVLRQAPGR